MLQKSINRNRNRNNKKRGKKGLSEMVSYVLLVVIAISISVLVYSWLNGNLWVKKEGCPDGASLIIEDYTCHDKVLSLTVKNMGTFNLDGFIIKGTNKTGKQAIYPLQRSGKHDEQDGQIYFPTPMKPGDSKTYDFDFGKLNALKLLDIEPVRIQNEKIVLCEDAVINQELKDCGVISGNEEQCGNNICEANIGENCGNCVYDCGCASGYSCNSSYACVPNPSCTPNCASPSSVQCGLSITDANSCGSCASGTNCASGTCSNGVCVGTTSCTPSCASGESCFGGVCGFSVDSCRILNTADKTYFLTSSITNNDLTGPCISISAQNITLNCAGFSISSDDFQAGVYSNQLNTKIKNCNVDMGGCDMMGQGLGILLNGADNSYIFNNTLNSQCFGIDIQHTQHATIEKIIANNNNHGINLDSSSNNILNLVTANNNQAGIFLHSGSSNNILTNITANDNNGGVGINIFSDSGPNNILTNITANNNDYGIFLASSNNILNLITATNNNYAGIGLYINSNNNLIKNSRVCGNNINYDLYCDSQWDSSSTVSCDNAKKDSCSSITCSAC